MSTHFNIITTTSNKTIEIYSVLEGNLEETHQTNDLWALPYDTSYVIYLKPLIEEITYTGFLNNLNNIFSGFLGYVWIIGIGILAYILLRSLKNHV